MELPLRATQPFRVIDETSGVAIAVALDGARDANAEIAAGYVVYRDAYEREVSIVHRVTAAGTEDFLTFERAPRKASVTYTLALGDRVAGVRKVENTVELLDSEGVPRLRVSPPFLVDRLGARHDASIDITGCFYDTDPAGPWGRPATDPQARSCTLVVAWDGSAVSYPAVLDPSWTTTGSMSIARYHHTATVAPNGQVLVAGGDNGTALTSAELYDPTTATWATTANMTTARWRHTATALPDGQILVAGGYPGSTSAELYDAATGMWSPTANMAMPRYWHTASLLPDARVLVAGGFSGSGCGGGVELYDVATGTWSTTDYLSFGRCDHTATVLFDGRVLVAGGWSTTYWAEIYDPLSGMWTSASFMAGYRRHSAIASLLPDGRVMVAGGFIDNPAIITTSVEIYDPVSGLWSLGPSMAQPPVRFTASSLTDGRILVAGGGTSTTSSAEVYDPIAQTWSATPDMTTPRQAHTAASSWEVAFSLLEASPTPSTTARSFSRALCRLARLARTDPNAAAGIAWTLCAAIPRATLPITVRPSEIVLRQRDSVLTALSLMARSVLMEARACRRTYARAEPASEPTRSCVRHSTNATMRAPATQRLGFVATRQNRTEPPATTTMHARKRMFARAAAA